MGARANVRLCTAALATVTVAASIALGPAAGAGPNHALAKPYDINGDGYRDLVVSAPRDRPQGEVRVALGSAHGFKPGGQLSRATLAMTSADFNGDGYADIASTVRQQVIVDYGDRHHPAKTGHTQYISPQRQRSDVDVVGAETNQWDSTYYFGHSLATGDFNHDGFPDLAIGDPGAEVPLTDLMSDAAAGSRAAGAVLIHYGGPTGLDNSGQLSPGHYEEWNERTAHVDGGPANNDYFGYSLAVADLNGDGVDDLVVGIPGKDIDGYHHAGAVTELFGTPSGLSAAGSATFSLQTPGVDGDASHQQACEEDDYCFDDGENFGAALAAGDIDGDGFADVAVGIPDKNVVPGPRADGEPSHDGALSILFGSSTGITSRSQFISRKTRGVPGSDRLQIASQLVMGDFDGDGYDDVAAVAPQAKTPHGCGCETVLVLRGARDGLTVHGLRQISEARWTAAKNRFAPNGFGTSMLAIDFNGDGLDDLVVGAPQQSDRASAAGSIFVFWSGTGGLSDRRATRYTQRGVFAGSHSYSDEFGYVGSQYSFYPFD
jgi:hypothetical protein